MPWSVPARPGRAPFACRAGVAFIGDPRLAPNLDAASWLLDAVMPLVWREAGDVRCIVAGSPVPEQLQRHSGPLVNLMGPVSDLRREVLDTVRLTAAPLRFGAGVKGNVLDSRAAGVPCAMTPVTAEGLDLPATMQAQVSAQPRELAAMIRRMHGDWRDHAAIAAAGLQYVAGRHASEVVTAGLGAALEAPARGATR